MSAPATTIRLPRDGLVRALMRVPTLVDVDRDQTADDEVSFTLGIELRDSSVDGSLGLLHGHFAVFDRWTEIASFWEGNFMERIAPGAFAKTIAEQRDSMRVLFQHGRDATVGMKPLGPISELSEDKVGAAYESPLLDTSYNRDLLPGLKAGLYGASFRFRVMREEIVDKPDPSKTNPRALPERTIKEVQCQEFGPVTFPAYAEATAGVRSLTDDLGEARDYWERLMAEPERAHEYLDRLLARRASGNGEPDSASVSAEPAHPDDDAEPPAATSASGDRDSTTPGIAPTSSGRRPSWALSQPRRSKSWHL